VLALGLLVPAFAEDEKQPKEKDKEKQKEKDKADKDNPAAKKLNRDVGRHYLFLSRVEKGRQEAVLKEMLGEEKYKEYLSRLAKTKGEGDVIFLGDSITHGWEGQPAWKEHFGAFKPVNLGIGGDQTGHVLWRITDGKELEHLNPKVAVIMIGTNNTGGHSAEQIAGGIKAIIDELRKQKPEMKILLLGVFPRGPNTKGVDVVPAEKLNPKIKQINDLISNSSSATCLARVSAGRCAPTPSGMSSRSWANRTWAG